MKTILRTYISLQLIVALFLVLVLPMVGHSQSQKISGSGVPNSKSVKREFLKSQNKKDPIIGLQKRIAQNRNASKVKPSIADSTNPTNGLSGYFNCMSNYNIDSTYLHPNTSLLFYAEIWANYVIDSSNVTVTIDYGDGTSFSAQPYNFQDTVSGVVSDFFKLFFHSYSSAGVYVPKLKIKTTTGDSLVLYLFNNDTAITITNGSTPPSYINDFLMYSDQYCDSMNLVYNGSYVLAGFHSYNLQSEFDSFVFTINYGDGLDSTFQLNVIELFISNGYWFNSNWYLPFNIKHNYNNSGTYNTQFIISFPEGITDTAWSEAHVASQCNMFNGYVYIDNNSNCVKDLGEEGLSNIYLNTSYYQDSIYFNDCFTYESYALTDSSGNYAFYIPDNCHLTDSIFLDTYWNFYGLTQLPVLCPYTGYYQINTVSPASGLDFALGCDTAGYDLNGNMYGWRFRPGFEGYIYPSFINRGCEPVNGTVTLFIDNPGYLTIDSVSPAPISINSTTITWEFNNYSINDWYQNMLVVVSLGVNASIGDSITAIMTLNPLIGDLNPSNNIVRNDYVVSNSWDPNEKLSFPQSSRPDGPVSPDQELNYVVHFQNTGTDTAYNIFVIDTLDQYLDLLSLRVLSSSHYMSYTLTDRVLSFNFPSIMLPDSSKNEAGSQGSVSYSISPISSLPEGTIMRNTGYIYFDYNPAVVTNTTINTICNSVSVNDIPEPNDFIVFPNPASDLFNIKLKNGRFLNSKFQIQNITGQILYSGVIDNINNSFDVSFFSNGVYLVKIFTEKNIYIKKLIKS
ncbi:MAG: T9SS type A sorting domain-containing protein [Bacteroidota bacterium]